MELKKLVLLGILLASFGTVSAKTKVIAHRGFWNAEGSAQNSIAALTKANEIKVYGSEFDVWLSSDGVPVINHNPTTDDNHLLIEKTPITELKKEKLANGEYLPTLEEYLLKGKQCKNIKLIVELKPQSSKEREDSLTAIVLDMVKKMKLKKKVEYISFSLNTVKEIIRLDSKAKVSYLTADLSPKELKKIGCVGLDYNLNAMIKNENWFSEAKKVGIKINVWTVNKEEDMHYLIKKGADFITTNEPQLAKELTNNK